MNKKLIAIGITILFIIVGFSGCTEQETTLEDIIGQEDTTNNNRAELVSYTIKTYYDESGWEGYQYRGNGFIHDYDAVAGKYEITGTIKNIAGYKLSSIGIEARFYDKNHNFLCKKYGSVSNIANSYTEDFKITYKSMYDSDSKYFLNVDSVELEILA